MRRRIRYITAVAAAVALVASGAAFAAVQAGGNRSSVNVVTGPGTTAATTPPPTVPPTTLPPTTAAARATTQTAPTTSPASTTSTTSTTPTTSRTVPTAIDAPAAVACGALVPVAGPSGSVRAKAVDGTVTATLSGTMPQGIPGQNPLDNPRLVVTSASAPLLDDAVAAPRIPNFEPGSQVIPTTLTTSPGTTTHEPVCLARFAGSTNLTVLLGFTAGGAHCCTAVRTIPLTGSGAGTAVDTNLGNPGADVRTLGTNAVLVTADNSFAYTFASYAESGMPILIESFHGNAFADATRQYPALVSADAAQWWQAWSAPANAGNGLGLLAPWAADECQLGQCNQAFATINQLNSQGKLTGPAGWSTGTAYVSQLHAFLIQRGYATN